MYKGAKIAFFGCKNGTGDCIEYFQKNIGKIDLVISIDSDKADKVKVAGYMDLSDVCQKFDIPIYFVNKYSLKNEDDCKFIKGFNIDLAFVFSWQRIIPSNILNEIKYGVYGMHGSPDHLPKGRGRSPLNWSLITGRKEFYANLFKYESSVDGGSIIDTKIFEIHENDTIETLYFKCIISMNQLIEKNLDSILDHSVEFKKQGETGASYFPKRVEEDGFIDWNLKSIDIFNLVRAVAKPFPGAFSYIGKTKIKIWDLKPFSSLLADEKRIPGEIIEVFYNKKIIVRTGDGSVIIHDYECEDDSQIKKGEIFKSKSFIELFSEIENRYYEFVKEGQKEITVQKLQKIYL